MSNISGVGTPPSVASAYPPLPKDAKTSKEPKKPSGCSGLDVDFTPPMPPVGGIAPLMIVPDNAYFGYGISISAMPCTEENALASKVPSALRNKLIKGESAHKLSFSPATISAGVPKLFKIFASYSDSKVIIKDISTVHDYSKLTMGASARLDPLMVGYVRENRKLHYRLQERGLWPSSYELTTDDNGTVRSHSDYIIGKYNINDYITIGGIVPFHGDPMVTLEAFRIPPLFGLQQDFLSAGAALNKKYAGIDLTFINGFLSLNAMTGDNAPFQVGGSINLGWGLVRSR